MKKINRQYIFIILQQSNKIAFGSSQERDFSQSIFSGRQQIIKTFIIKQILWKLMANFFFRISSILSNLIICFIRSCLIGNLVQDPKKTWCLIKKQGLIMWRYASIQLKMFQTYFGSFIWIVSMVSWHTLK